MVGAWIGWRLGGFYRTAMFSSKADGIYSNKSNPEYWIFYTFQIMPSLWIVALRWTFTIPNNQSLPEPLYIQLWLCKHHLVWNIQTKRQLLICFTCITSARLNVPRFWLPRGWLVKSWKLSIMLNAQLLISF